MISVQSFYQETWQPRLGGRTGWESIRFRTNIPDSFALSIPPTEQNPTSVTKYEFPKTWFTPKFESWWMGSWLSHGFEDMVSHLPFGHCCISMPYQKWSLSSLGWWWCKTCRPGDHRLIKASACSVAKSILRVNYVPACLMLLMLELKIIFSWNIVKHRAIWSRACKIFFSQITNWPARCI